MLVKRLPLVVLALGLGLALSGCGGRKTETVTVTVTTSPSTTSTTAEQSAEVTAAVVQLQEVMTSLGYYDGPIDGVYGDATTAGVKKMQEDLGVTADGQYGQATHDALKGKGESIVMDLQTTLQTYGYYDGEIDGAYGTATQDAVKRLQTDLGVTADGKFGPETQAAFQKAVEDGTVTPKS